MRRSLHLLCLVLCAAVAVAVACSSPAARPAKQSSATAAPTSTGRPTATEPFRAVFLGDSYTAASETGGGYALRTAAAMDWTAVLAAFGGTGYATAGQLPGGAPYADRLDEVVADDPDVVVVQGSTNDIGSPVATVGAAAVDLYTELQRRLPEARLVVLGPTAPPGVERAAALAVRDAVQAAAEYAGIPFVDPIVEGWLTPADGLYADPIHPNQAGYDQFADDLVRALRDQGF